MDKLGHALTTYTIGLNAHDALRWAGMEEKKAIWIGGSTGWAYLSMIEVMDGFSSGWGFSWGDFAFNTLGAGMFIGQQLAWKEQKFQLKWSYHPTDYPYLNPDLLGSTHAQRWLKDYNGQTYWLSANPRSILGESIDWWPKWLNVAGGYGAEGMITAENFEYSDHPNIVRQRKYYLSLDIDTRRINVKSGFLKTVLHVLSFVKIPAPTIQFNEKHGGTQFHWLFF